MNLPKAELIPEDPDHLPPARRRRARRLLAPLDADEKEAILADIAHQSSPTFDFFWFSLLAGVVIASGLLLDQPSLLLLGSLLAPLMAPVVGLSLGAITGSMRFFLRSMAGLLVGSLLVFLTGVAAGYVIRSWYPHNLNQAYAHAQISWENLLVLAAGGFFTPAIMLRNGQRAGVASVALAYGLYIPLVVAGFGLTSGYSNLFLDGLVIFSIHLAWASLLGAITLAILGFRPLTLFGYTFGAALTILGIILLIGLGGTGAVFGGQIALPTPIPTATFTVTPSVTPSLTPHPPTATLTPTLTYTPSPTPTDTLTPTPTPMYALIRTEGGTGALLRDEPGGVVIGSYFDGTLLQVLPGSITQNGTVWVRVIAPDGNNGWIVQSLLVTATPAPNW